MIAILEEVKEWADKINDKDWDKLLDDDFRPGDRLVWCFKDDLKYWQEWNPDTLIDKTNFQNFSDYKGIVVPLPDLELNKIDSFDLLYYCFICVTYYPCEKCYPTADWISLGRLITNPDVLWIKKFKE